MNSRRCWTTREWARWAPSARCTSIHSKTIFCTCRGNSNRGCKIKCRSRPRQESLALLRSKMNSSIGSNRGIWTIPLVQSKRSRFWILLRIFRMVFKTLLTMPRAILRNCSKKKPIISARWKCRPKIVPSKMMPALIKNIPAIPVPTNNKMLPVWDQKRCAQRRIKQTNFWSHHLKSNKWLAK